MAKSEQKKQKQQAKKRAAANKEKRMLAQRKNRLLSTVGQARHASRFPVYGCYIGSGAYQIKEPSTVLFGRQVPGVGIVSVIMLIDLACLGVKDAFLRVLTETMLPVDPSVVVTLIETAVEYASRFGISPAAEFANVMPIFDGIGASDCHEDFHVGGPEGLPYYIAGPNDPPARQKLILSKLHERAGEGRYHFMIPTSPSFDVHLASAEEYEYEDDEEYEEDDDDMTRGHSPFAR